jgi:hypothetical protein
MEPSDDHDGFNILTTDRNFSLNMNQEKADTRISLVFTGDIS